MKRAVLVVCALIVAAAATAQACNIPVFRYALERWRPDVSEFIVYHAGELDLDAQSLVKRLKEQARAASANAEVRLVDVALPPSVQQDPVWLRLEANSNDLVLPHLLVRLPHARGPLNAWHGSLQEALDSALVESPVRRELSRRLLAGDSIVWLLIKSPQEKRNTQIRKLLQEQNKRLSSKIQLPEGIGLPGSELFSEVPLFLKFSQLEIDPNDPKEQFMLKLLSSFQEDSFREGEPLVVPVFGRGRALEVIPADGVDEQLIADLTAFLCGACSCQIKEQNPGFDLLLSADWDTELFGENAALPPPAKSVGEGDRSPALLTIPPGR